MSSLQFDEVDLPYVENEHVRGTVLEAFDGVWYVQLELGPVEIGVTGRPGQPPNEWKVGDVAVWIDRRAALEADYSGMSVAKLQDYDNVAWAITMLVANRETVTRCKGLQPDA